MVIFFSTKIITGKNYYSQTWYFFQGSSPIFKYNLCLIYINLYLKFILITRIWFHIFLLNIFHFPMHFSLSATLSLIIVRNFSPLGETWSLRVHCRAYSRIHEAVSSFSLLFSLRHRDCFSNMSPLYPWYFPVAGRQTGTTRPLWHAYQCAWDPTVYWCRFPLLLHIQ